MSECFKCYYLIFGYTSASLIFQLRTEELRIKKINMLLYYIKCILRDIQNIYSRPSSNINRCFEIMPVFNSRLILQFVSVGMCTSLNVPLRLFVSRFFLFLQIKYQDHKWRQVVSNAYALNYSHRVAFETLI
jgi:hypothetical protein